MWQNAEQPKHNMKNTTKITTVSEYISKGGMKLDMYLLESPARETEKALGFPCVQFSSYGNPYNGIAWIPKSQISKVENDFYTEGPKEMYLCPGWLYKKAFKGGEVMLA